MDKIYIFILIITFVFICVSYNIGYKENFKLNKYKIILINHEKFNVLIVKNTNNSNTKIYKIYKN